MIVVAYNGVHQAFQIALAAEEAGLLGVFYTALFDAPGKWGRLCSRFLGKSALSNRRLAGLGGERVVEYPWPELLLKLRSRLSLAASNEWIFTSHAFDRWVSKRIKQSSAAVFVGVENCAFESFRVARSQGMKLVYDCPGYNARHTEAAAKETARRFGLTLVSVGDTAEMVRRKEAEMALADLVLSCSEVHAASLRLLGVPAGKLVVNPLWIDPSFWYPPERRAPVSSRLRVLYAGAISLRKGIPFLVEAARKVNRDIELTLVGGVSDDIRPVLEKACDWVTIRPRVGKLKLRQIFWRSDLLVLPSLGDSFGFVALEAMACGLPVIVTENCGVPVPDPAWRVPTMDSTAIAERLEYYTQDRDALVEDGHLAGCFARQFTPERYRTGIQGLLRRLLKQ